MTDSLNIYRMVIPSLHQLNWHALQYAMHCAVQTEKHMRRGEVKIKPTSYPACAACFESEVCGSLSYGYSGQYRLQPNSFRTPLRKMLQTLGVVGGISNITGSRNPIGRCAEVCAVNTFLYECEKCLRSPYPYYYMCRRDCAKSTMNAGAFMISEAFRPRTLEHIERCDNCKKLFGSNY